MTTAILFFVVGGGILVTAVALLSDPDIQRSLANMITDFGKSIKSLCESVVKAIDDALSKAKTKTKKNTYERHHIVAKAAKAAQPARDVLSNRRVRIGLNSPLNLVDIKYNLHRHLHTNAYYNAVNVLVQRGSGSYTKTVSILNFIRSALMAASKVTP